MQLAMLLLQRGDHAPAGGWLARAKRLLDDGRRDCVEVGYLMVPAALQSLFQGDAAAAVIAFHKVIEIGDRFGDGDLLAYGRLGLGQSLLQLGDITGGVALLDEIMVAVTSGEISPIIAGVVYCSVIESCHAIFDLRRAHEWTAALDRWCDTQSGLVGYRGSCLIFRARIMQLHGAWPDAIVEATKAAELLSGPPQQLGFDDAFYQLGEIHRLRGEFSTAEAAYRRASEIGRSPQPGLAQMRLMQGQVDTAAAAIRRERDEARDLASRAKVLPVFVEIMIAAHDIEGARAGADELLELARGLDAPFLRAVSAQAQGAVLLAEGDDTGALASLRLAWNVWRELDAPYEASRARVLIGLACRRRGDEDAARMELDSARHVFDELGAAADAARVDQLLGKTAPKATGGLSAREVEVLRLVAAGKSNKAIASHLVISDKTVARHVSNIFTKLGLSSRAAATAYAYEHGLNQPPT
jgi:DNA-binding CsgD family transcriptional regulator